MVLRKIIGDTNGDAVVEATILFPVMILIFAALVLLAIYLPTRAVLQSSTQYAATTIASTLSDTWLCYDEDSMGFRWETDGSRLPNVYSALFSNPIDVESLGEEIVMHIQNRMLGFKAGKLMIEECYIVNRLIYKEVVITATREIEIPLNLSIIRFPEVVAITVTSTAVVQNGDEFIRNMDLAVDFVEYINEKFHLSDISDSIGSSLGEVASFFGW